MAACAPSDEEASQATAENALAEETQIAVPAAVDPTDPALVEWIRAEHEGYADDLRFAHGDIDLNGDGENETLVYVFGRLVCGSGGCNAYVLRKEAAGYSKISGHTVSNLPIGAFETQTNRWRDLAITVRGGGLENGPDVARLPFDGTRYPLNPTVLPAERTDESFEIVLPDVDWRELQPLP